MRQTSPSNDQKLSATLVMCSPKTIPTSQVRDVTVLRAFVLLRLVGLTLDRTRGT